MNTQSKTQFNTDTTAVRLWIEALPLASTGESAKRIYNALHQVNTQALTVKHRMEFLESVAEPLNQVYPQLTQYFQNASLPLSNKSRSVLTITNAILTDMLKGFQIVIKNLLSEKPFGWKKPFALALHRAMIYYSKILCNQRLSHQPYPNGIWHQVYWCYQQAEQLGLLGKTYHHCDGSGKTSIEYEFTRLLLLSLVTPQDLGAEGMRQLHDNMELWIKNTHIHEQEPQDKKTCFTINMLSDVPPYLVGTRNDRTSQTASRRYLDTQPLTQLLENYLAKSSDSDQVKISRNHFLSQHTLHTLLNNWSRKLLRQELRKRGTGFMDIAIGISAINFILSQHEQPAPDISHETSPTSGQLQQNNLSLVHNEPASAAKAGHALGLGYFISDNDQQHDVWDMVYNYPRGNQPLPPDWTESGIHTVYHFHKAEMVDFSEKGYCLSIKTDDIENLRYNDLVAVREHSLANWSLGQIMWLHVNNQKQVQFGLRILSRHVLPVNVRFSAMDSDTKPLACLLGLDDHVPILFLPNLPTRLQGKSIHLEHGHHHGRVELTDQVIRSSTFDAYKLHEKHQHHTTMATPTGMHGNEEINDNVWSHI